MTATTIDKLASIAIGKIARRAYVGACTVVVAVMHLTSQVYAAQSRSAADLSSCRAGHLASYVGRPYRTLQKIRPDARYVCSTCPMTMDFRRDRLTVTYDVRTQRIRTLRCV